MAMPIAVEDVRRVLQPWLGSLFLNDTGLCEAFAERMQGYAPYRQSLESLREELEALLLTRLNVLTNRTMTVVLDNYHTRRLRMADIAAIIDDLMGVVFDKMTPFSANFIKLNDYSMHVQSLNAMRVLYLKYASFYSEEEYAFLIHMIRGAYPRERYAAWLKD